MNDPRRSSRSACAISLANPITRTALVALAALVAVALAVPATHARDLTFGERVRAQEAIEQVYWQHRIWPKENPGPKPPLAAVMPEAAIRAKVEANLRLSALLGSFRQQPLTGAELQAEIDRMVRTTKAPEMLRELFAALDDDPFLIAECLARPTLAQRAELTAQPAYAEWASEQAGSWILDASAVTPPEPGYSVAAQPLDGCTDDTWTPTVAEPPPMETVYASYRHTAVWTGSEMIVWGGEFRGSVVNTGRRYDPATDTWTPLELDANAPHAREDHAAVWTGSEMIVWGGKFYDESIHANRALNTGGRYSPSTNSWATSSLTTGAGVNVPTGREWHTAVWTGSEMIVWGGQFDDGVGHSLFFNTGGRYNPSSDSWEATSLITGSGANVPAGRSLHSAIWTGSEMIVWGGTYYDGMSHYLNTGGRYDPATDSWASSSLTTGSGANAPSVGRSEHTAVWTGFEMIVWGGYYADGTTSHSLNTGGRYNPSTDSWSASTLTTGSGANVPVDRAFHSAVWTGSEMIVWGGVFYGNGTQFFNTGGRYDPSIDAWTASSLTTGSGANVPDRRAEHSAVWTGSSGHRMIVWGGAGYGDGITPSGALYCARACADRPEICDGIDNNCNGQIDEDPSGVDPDEDGALGACDNCPLVANADQSNLDGDAYGDACDPCPLDAGNDADRDGVCGNVDNCPGAANTDQANADGDLFGDVCDPCPLDNLNDVDVDGVCGDVDNCPTVANADQADSDGDGIGDACPVGPIDQDGDGVPDDVDACDQSILDPTVIVPPAAPPPPPPGSHTNPIRPCDSGVPNYLLSDGCTISDKIAACDATTTNKGQFDKCVKRVLNQLRRQHVITEQQRRKIDRCVKHYKKRDTRHHGCDDHHGSGGHDH